MPADASGLKAQIQGLSLALQDLHRELLMLEAKRLEGDMDRKITPYELLHASLHDSSLAWLRSISALIVNIDTILDETTNLSGQEAHQIADAVLTLLEKPESTAPSEFWIRYTSFLSQADIIMKHSRVKELVMKMRPKT